MVSGLVDDVQTQMRANLPRIVFQMRSVRDVCFASQYRLDGPFSESFSVHVLVCGTAFIVEFLKRKKVAVVRHGQRGHAKHPRPLDERPDAALSVKERVARVKMQVDEVRHC